MRQAGRTNSEPVNRPAVINLVRKGLEHTDDKLRRASGRLAVHLYRESRSAGETVDVSQLTGGLNPALTRALHRHMHAVDAELGLPSLVPEDDAPVAKSALPEDRPTASLPPVARRPGALKPIKSKAVGAPGGVLAGVMGWGLNEGEKADGTSEMWSTVGSLPKVLDDTDEALLEAMLESHQA